MSRALETNNTCKQEKCLIIKMNIITVVLSFLLLLMSCSNITNHNRHLCVKPLAPAVHLDSLSDCTLSVAFSVNDFNWEDCRLTLSVYSEQLYDASEIEAIKADDTIVINDVKNLVFSIEYDDNHYVINGGIEQGGLELISYVGGTFRSVTFDDHPVYILIGEATIPFDHDLVITDCGENPSDAVTTIVKEQKQYLCSLSDYHRDFNPLNTVVRIENGVLKEIIRKWIP